MRTLFPQVFWLNFALFFHFSFFQALQCEELRYELPAASLGGSRGRGGGSALVTEKGGSCLRFGSHRAQRGQDFAARSSLSRAAPGRRR